MMLVVMLMITTVMASGCNESEAIVKHRVPKSRSGLDDMRNAKLPFEEMAEQAKAITNQRMIVAMYEQPESTWFFKVTANADNVTKAEADCKKLFDTVTFVDGEPVWKAPGTWTEGKKSSVRFATLLMDQESPATEMSIMPLGPDQDLLLNANRWLGQLSLPPVTQDTLGMALNKIDSGIHPYYLFDATGKGSGQMGGAPFAPFANRGNSGTPMAKPPVPAVQPPAESGPKFSAPEGWEQAPPSSMVPVKLKKTVDDQSVEITLIGLALMNKWDDNVKRWAGQLGLTTTDDDIEGITEAFQIDEIEGKLVRFIDESKSKAIVAIMIKTDDTAWFVKLFGDRELAAEEVETFLTFAKSIKF